MHLIPEPRPSAFLQGADYLRPTKILDYQDPTIQELIQRLQPNGTSPRAYLQAGFCLVREAVRPIYTVDEWQPTSKTIVKGQGSCSQRMACLESLARAAGIATRVRGLWISGQFWSPRFKLTRRFIPSRILLAWPQFYLDEEWIDVDELFGSSVRLAEQNPHCFSNSGESLFDALDHTALDFEGRTAGCSGGVCDLSRFVLEEAGTFDSRDELFTAMPSFQFTLRGRVFELLYGGRKSN